MADPGGRPRRSLPAVERADAHAVIFIQEIAEPVLRDNWPQGFDYVCGHCGTMVLASCVVDDQLWDLMFQCFGCKRLSLSPVLPPGRALPPQRAVIEPDVYPITSTKDL